MNLGRRSVRYGLVVAAVFLGATGVAFATQTLTATDVTTQAIHACQLNKLGTLRIVADVSMCNATYETPLSWNVAGPKGDQGPAGPTGAAGAAGAKGDTGATGSQGPAGPQGSTGDTGATGDTGPQGQQGAKGDAGAPGAKGEIGSNGADGTSVIAAAAEADGPCVTGGFALTSSSGASLGYLCNGLQGPAGRDGNDGANGLDAVDGLDGRNGVDGTDGTSVTVSDAGANCSNGGSALTAAGGTSYVCNGAPGAKGATGIQGPLGPPGPQGPPGPAGDAAAATDTWDYLTSFGDDDPADGTWSSNPDSPDLGFGHIKDALGIVHLRGTAWVRCRNADNTGVCRPLLPVPATDLPNTPVTFVLVEGSAAEGSTAGLRPDTPVAVTIGTDGRITGLTTTYAFATEVSFDGISYTTRH